MNASGKWKGDETKKKFINPKLCIANTESDSVLDLLRTSLVHLYTICRGFVEQAVGYKVIPPSFTVQFMTAFNGLNAVLIGTLRNTRRQQQRERH